MRSILILLLLFVTLASLAAVGQRPADTPESNQPPAAKLDWVRTTDGWEHPALWQPPPSLGPRLHPGLVAGFLALASATLLLAAAPTGRSPAE